MGISPVTSTDTAPLRVAMLAPPWIPIPAPGYGGIETVIDQLCNQLVAEGVSVTLFAAPGSRSRAPVRPVLDAVHPDEIGAAIHEADHVAMVMQAVDAAASAGTPFDVVHDHCGFTALAMADRITTPMVHTIHGEFAPSIARFYRRHGHKASLVAISPAQHRTAPDGVTISAIVPNPITVEDWPLVCAKEPHLVWLGRMHETKGAHRAIVAARLADRPLIIAGPVQAGQEQFFAEHVAPHIDGDRVVYVGEVGGSVKRRLLSQAAALLMPIRWAEPFGMVMVEALACGTPVIAFAEGAARDIVVEGVNGFLVDGEEAMARAVGRLDEIDPRACRSGVRARFDIRRVSAGYQRVYGQASRRHRARSSLRVRTGDPREPPPTPVGRH